MLGLDGIGKSTIIELSTYICNYEMFRLNKRKGYNYQDFRDDLKIAFKHAGVQNKKVVLFIPGRDIFEVDYLKILFPEFQFYVLNIYILKGVFS